MVKISFEFFPPQTDRGRTNLLRTALRLNAFRPAFYSVTYGAGGTTRDRTFATVAHLHEAGLPVAPHLSWGSDDEAHVLDMLARYRDMGIDRLVALRGDVPSGIGTGGLTRHAEDLVRLIRRHTRRHANEPPLKLEVAAYPEVHPEAPSATVDIDHLKRKVDAGADSCITQFFYNADGYFHFRDRCAAAGINVPIVPGVMPITSATNLMRFSDKVGAEIPRWIRKRLEELEGDSDAVIVFGTEVATVLCQRLLRNDAPGIHFYTLNKAGPTAAIVAALNLGRRDQRSRLRSCSIR